MLGMLCTLAKICTWCTKHVSIVIGRMFWTHLLIHPVHTPCRYFQYSYITPPLPYRKAGKHTLYVHFPHGSFPMGSWLSVGATQQEGLFTQITYHLASNHQAEHLLAFGLHFISQALPQPCCAFEQHKLGMRQQFVHNMTLM